MIILAGFAIGAVTGSGTNLISKAQSAVFKAKVADIRDRLEMAKSATLIRTGGYLTWDEYKKTVKEWFSLPDSAFKDNGDGTHTIYIDGIPFIVDINDPDFPIYGPDDPYVKPEIRQTEDGRYVADLINSINVANYTSRSVTINVQTKPIIPNDNGIDPNPTNTTYKYYIKEAGAEDWTEDGGESVSSTHTFDGLTQDTRYMVKVICSTDYTMTETDPVPGQVIRLYSDPKEKEVYTVEVPSAVGQIEWQYSKEGWHSENWTNGDVTITISPKIEGYRLQSKLDTDSNEGSWNDDNTSVTVSRYGQTLSARYWDDTSGTGNSATNVGLPASMNVNFIDKEAPTAIAPTVMEQHSNKIKVRLNQTDTLSGIETVEWKIGTNKITNEITLK